jgi:hypothetical protein
MTENRQTQGAIKILQHESEVLKNNPLSDAHIRDLYVYCRPITMKTKNIRPFIV